MYIPVPSYGELSLGPAKEDSQLVSSMALLGGHRLSRARLFMCVCGSGLCVSICVHAGGSQKSTRRCRSPWLSTVFFEAGPLNLYLAIEDRLTG